ncbi:hypothetical protein V2W30_01000 [Streptomyces sp. Q6]|uniref:Uncharacterized protein n=1 Tax=Streptomyces citrinus TaxID=3118173 RepID=A0ACD5A4R5_9ACTN
MGEDGKPDSSDADIDRRFAAIVRDMATDVEPEERAGHTRRAMSAGEVKPMWYLVPLRMICTITFFMTLSTCIAAYGCVMTDARWGTATLISFCVAVGSAVCRRAAKARYDRRDW